MPRGVFHFSNALNGAVRAAIRPRCELVLDNLALSTTARPAASKDRTTAIWSHRPSVLDVAVLHMVGLDARAGNRETVVCPHGEGFRRFWDLAIAGARARRTSFSIERNPSARMPHGEPQSVMGVRRASTASSPSSGARSRSARSAGFCRAAGVRGRSGSAGSWRTKLVFWPRWILRRTDRDIPRALRLLILAHEPRRIVHFAVTRRRLRGQRSKLPRRSHGKRLRGVSSEIATRPTWSSRAGQTNWHRRIDYGRAFAFAESVCRAREPNNPSRAAHSRHLARQAAPSAAAPGIRGLLPTSSNASVARQGHARAARRRAGVDRTHPRGGRSWWSPSSLLQARCIEIVLARHTQPRLTSLAWEVRD